MRGCFRTIIFYRKGKLIVENTRLILFVCIYIVVQVSDIKEMEIWSGVD